MKYLKISKVKWHEIVLDIIVCTIGHKLNITRAIK